MPTAKPSGVSSTKGMGATSSARPVGLQYNPLAADKPVAKMHKRSRSGCFTCRLRRKKCDEGHPSCKACTNLSVKCEYKRPVWWGSPDQRRLQKERIKDIIKKTKSLERSASNSENGGRIQTCISPPPLINEHDFNRPIVSDLDSFGPHFSTPGFVPITYSHHFPYDVDVRTERQTFVNDVPLRHDSSVSTFSAMGPPQLHATLPTFPADEWFQEEYFEPAHEYSTDDSAVETHGVGQSYASLHANIPVDDYDRPLLNHFVENVLRMIFPILEVHQRGSARARAVLQSLETNKSYFHCCLSVAAIHLKTSSEVNNEQIDHDIMRHRYEAISELCQSLNKDSDHEHILDATLAMIFFHCSVGAPDDCLPDIHWSDHFQAVSNLVDKLDLTNQMVPCGNAYMVPPFSMSLTSWIDILGATMLGETPQFAHTYRNKHLSGASSGLRELMGCDDRVMYLISEIACLESLKNDGRIDSITLCTHVSALGNQLEYTEPADPSLESPYLANGSIRPEVLTKNMTTMFRLAARVYLCSLVPGADRNHSSTRNLVSAIAETLAFIPAGPFGFDRSLVWPILIAGVNSTPGSTFRQALNDRIIALGELADFGSFGRMFQLMTEYWRLTDDPEDSPTQQDAASDSVYQPPVYQAPVYQAPQSKYESPDSPPLPSPGMRTIKRQQVHWRDVMNRNGWRYLLI